MAFKLGNENGQGFNTPAFRLGEEGSDGGEDFGSEEVWGPLLLGSKLVNWWDASTGVTLSTNKVTAWADRKAGLSAAQGTDAARPIYSATGFNDKPGITFDGTDDFLRAAAHAMPTGAGVSELWALVEQSSLVADTAVKTVVALGAASGFDAQVRVGRTGAGNLNRGVSNVGTGGGAAIFPGQTTTDLSLRHVLRLQVGATSSVMSVDGLAGTVANGIPAIGAGNFSIGASGNTAPGGFWNGKVRDIISIAGALTTTEAASLLAYLNARK